MTTNKTGLDFIKVSVKMKAMSPIYSSGETLKDGQKIIGPKKYIPLRLTMDGKVLIPLKGKLRASVEKILSSMGEYVCNLDNDIRGCGRCKACDVFGSMSKRGRWLIRNLVSEEFAEEISNIYTHTTMRRNNYTVDLRRVFNLQEVEAGSIFNTEIIIFSPQKEDISLLKAGLESLEIFGVGGLVSKGYGQIKLTDFKIEEHSFSDFVG